MMLLVQVYALATAQVLAAWAATYVLLSTAAYALAWLLSRRASLAWQERLWRLALFGAPLAAGVRVNVAAFTDRGGTPAPFLASELTATTWPTIALLAAWGMLVLTVCVIALRALLRLRSLPRDPADEALSARVCRLALEIGAPRPLVTRTHALTAPAAIGTREVCLPYLHEPAGSLLAHELAHLARRDPWWSFAARCTALLCCMQPLNFVVVRRLELLAELACDRTAARITSPRALVHALSALAELNQRSQWLPQAGATQSGLMRRVQAIVTASPEPRLRPLAIVTRVLALTALLTLTPTIRAAPHSTANTLDWLAPSPEPPNPRMHEFMAAERELERAIGRVLPW